MRALRIITAAAFAVALVPFAAGAANAAPPTNDESSGAQAIHLGGTVQEDTTQATTTPADSDLNANCGAPEINASVWFTYSPTTAHNVVLDASASDYEAGIMVFDGTPTADSLISCGPVEAGMIAKAGHTYYIMAFSDNDTIGGNLVLTATNAPTPSAHIALAKSGSAFHTGAARLHGTYSCRHDDSFAFLSTHLLERAGRLKIQSDGGANVQCDGKRHQWSAKMVSPVGTYAKGHAVAKARIDVCGLLVCRHAKTKGHVMLARGHGSSRSWMLRPTTAKRAGLRPKVGLHSRWPGR